MVTMTMQAGKLFFYVHPKCQKKMTRKENVCITVFFLTGRYHFRSSPHMLVLLSVGLPVQLLKL